MDDQRLAQAERDFELIEPVFFTTSNVGGKGPVIGRESAPLKDANSIDALKAMRATGTVTSGAKKVQFVITAARPNLIRMETQANGRTLVQGYDGVDAPWEFDTGSWPPRYRPIAEAAASITASAAPISG